MKTPQQLQQQAVKDCEGHVASVLKGKFLIEPGEPHTDWNPLDFRREYDQPLIVWRESSDFDVVLDDQDKPVGYIDKDKYLNCQYRAMTHGEIIALAAATGYVPADSSVVSAAQGPHDCVEATLATEPERVDSPRYLVQINPTRKSIIAIVPEGVTP